MTKGIPSFRGVGAVGPTRAERGGRPSYAFSAPMSVLNPMPGKETARRPA